MTDDYKSDILDALTNEEVGEFAVGGSFSSPAATIPGLTVEGYGLVGLPLSVKAVEDLSKLAIKAPFGKGSETIVDESVRKTLEIDATKVTITNPAFNTALEQLVTTHVASTLGCPPNSTQVNLYKLLLYPPGGFFKPHKDTEKGPGMFGTLVIQLPCGFKGGALTVSHKNDTLTFDHSQNSAFQSFYTAFYADTTHELLPITEGYRCALVYNLVHRGQGPPPHLSSDDVKAKTTAIVHALKDWQKDENGPPFLLHGLSYEYTTQSLNFNQLKNDDREAAAILKAAAKRCGMMIHLGVLDRSVSSYSTKEPYRPGRYYGGGWGGGFHYHEDDNDEESEDDENDYEWAENESSTTLSELIDPKGVRPMESPSTRLSLSVNHFLCDDVDKVMGKPKDKSFQPYTGNESATMEKTYKCAALVIWPLHIHMDYMMKWGATQYSFDALAKVIQADGNVEKQALPPGLTSGELWLKILFQRYEKEGEIRGDDLLSAVTATSKIAKSTDALMRVLALMDPMHEVYDMEVRGGSNSLFQPQLGQEGNYNDNPVRQVLQMASERLGWDQLLPLLRQTFTRILQQPRLTVYHTPIIPHEVPYILRALKIVTACNPALASLQEPIQTYIINRFLDQTVKGHASEDVVNEFVAIYKYHLTSQMDVKPLMDRVMTALGGSDSFVFPLLQGLQRLHLSAYPHVEGLVKRGIALAAEQLKRNLSYFSTCLWWIYREENADEILGPVLSSLSNYAPSALIRALREAIGQFPRLRRHAMYDQIVVNAIDKIGPSGPRPRLAIPTDLQLKCACSICQEVNTWLKDPKNKSIQITSAGSATKKRKHLLESMRISGLDTNSYIVGKGHSSSYSLTKDPSRMKRDQQVLLAEWERNRDIVQALNALRLEQQNRKPSSSSSGAAAAKPKKAVNGPYSSSADGGGGGAAAAAAPPSSMAMASVVSTTAATRSTTTNRRPLSPSSSSAGQPPAKRPALQQQQQQKQQEASGSETESEDEVIDLTRLL